MNDEITTHNNKQDTDLSLNRVHDSQVNIEFKVLSLTCV